MNLLIWVAVGAVFGGVVSLLTKNVSGWAFNALVGTAGALIGGRVMPQLISQRRVVQDTFDLQALLLAVCGAVACLVVRSFVRTSVVRSKARDR